MYQALYYFSIKGYLSTADIFNEIADNKFKLDNSELLKAELFSQISNAPIPVDVKH